MTILRWLLLLVLIFIAGIAYILQSTGFFRDVKNSGQEILTSYPIAGAEDIAVSYSDGFLVISAFDRAAKRDGSPAAGNLYFQDLKNGAVPKIMTTDKPLAPHGISLLKLDSALYQLLVVNHTDDTHSIEVFELQGDQLTHKQTITGDPLIRPNDVVALDEDRFYVTNDHGTSTKLGLFAENYLGYAAANVVFYDGTGFSVAAEGIAYANGINVDAARRKLFVAASRSFSVLVYNIDSNGSLMIEDEIDTNTGVDNIEIDPTGLLWIGCHPSLMHFSRYAAGKLPISPSEIITLRYDGPGTSDITSVYISTGEAVSASSVAIPVQGRIYVGNVMDNKIVVIPK